MEERLQKVLARAGISSRRKAEMLILEGAVSVNGTVVTELGTKVNAIKDKIKVHGKLIMAEVEMLYLSLYKPKGMISALSDPEGRPTIGDLLTSVPSRVTPIGRMDFNSEGLMLLTNDGALSEKILKARELPKVFLIKIKGHPSEADLEFLKQGFFTRSGVLRFSSFGVDQSLRSKSWLRLEVTEGAKLDIKEIFNRKGMMVDRIIRSAVGHLTTDGMEPGEYKFLSRKEFEKLFDHKPSPQPSESKAKPKPGAKKKVSMPLPKKYR